MNDKPTHSTQGATKIEASKGGGAGKWLLGAGAAVVLAGGAYAAWQTFGADENRVETAYNEPYEDDPLRAGPLAPDEGVVEDDAEESAPAPAERRAAAPARRSTARADTTPEATIGVTPVNATADETESIVVTAPRRPVWRRTPSPRRLAALYPQTALDRGREGEARLHCTVEAGGALDCVRVEETPGFGAAALRVARTFRHAPTRADGADAVGTPVNLRVVFRIEDEEPRRIGRG